MRSFLPSWIKWPQMDIPLLASLFLLMGFGLVMWTLRRPRRSDAPKFQVSSNK